MNDEPISFREVIATAQKEAANKKAAAAQVEREEQERQRLNFKVVETTLESTVLPVFQEAAIQLRAAGGFAYIEDVKCSPLAKAIVLAVALNASSAVATQPPQTFKTLRYQGNPEYLAFKILGEGLNQSCTIPEITRESVTAQVSEFLKTI